MPAARVVVDICRTILGLTRCTCWGLASNFLRKSFGKSSISPLQG
jgi:hypothetical protein